MVCMRHPSNDEYVMILVQLIGSISMETKAYYKLKIINVVRVCAISLLILLEWHHSHPREYLISWRV